MTNPAQQFVLDSRMLESGFSCVLQLPTGSGKTWLARRAIRSVLDRGLRAIYLAPLRALAEELHPEWTKEFAPYPVGIFTGDYGTSGKDYPVPFGDARVLIMTPERLDASTRAWRSHWNWIPEVDLVVVDEVHMLGEARRGARLEGAISRFRRLNPFARFLCLSATLGNREEISDWLGGIEYESDWRPVPLTWRTVRFRKADEKPYLLAQEVLRTRSNGGRALVFVQSRRRSEVLATFLQAQGIRAGYHHAGLASSTRKSVENTFRSSELDVLIATGTLEMGLNLPVRQVVLYDCQAFDGSRFSPLSVNTVWQRAGRAGRPGQDTSGEVVLLAPTWDKQVDSYARGCFERIESPLSHPAALAEQVIAEIGSGLCRSEEQLRRALQSSLAGFQRQSMPIEETVRTMLDAGMIRISYRENADPNTSCRLAPTALGRVATRHLLQPATVLMARRFLERFQAFSRFDVLFALALTDDCEPILPVDFEELVLLSDRIEGIHSHAISHLPAVRKIFEHPSGKRLLSAIKTACMILDWCASGETEVLAERHGVYPFEIERLKDSLDRLLLAASAVSQILYGEPPEKTDKSPVPKAPETLRLMLLRAMVSTGLPSDAASLAMLEGIGPKWARKLIEAGFRDIASLGNALPEELAKLPGLSSKRATDWISRAKALDTTAGLPAEPNAPVIRPVTQISPAEREPEPRFDRYRMRRSLELHVTKRSDIGYVVTGGLEPHQVNHHADDFSCDCPDHANGNRCKHILAVERFVRGEELANTPKAGCDEPDLDLHALWMEA